MSTTHHIDWLTLSGNEKYDLGNASRRVSREFRGSRLRLVMTVSDAAFITVCRRSSPHQNATDDIVISLNNTESTFCILFAKSRFHYRLTILTTRAAFSHQTQISVDQMKRKKKAGKRQIFHHFSCLTKMELISVLLPFFT